MDNNLTPEIIDAEPISPVEMNKPETMDFPDAIRQLINGKRIARVEWHNADYGVLRNGWLTIFRDGTFHTWLVNDGDLMADDFIVLADLN